MRAPAAARPALALLVALSATMAMSLVPGSARAQATDGFAGRTIAGIRLVVDGRQTVEPYLLRVLETRVGDPYSSLIVRESIVHLMALRRFEDVRVSAEEAGGGIVLTYELDPVLTVTGIRFSGDLGLPAGQLRAAVVDRYTSSPPLERADEIAGTLESLLLERGFRSARVTAKHEITRAGTRAALVFEIAAGSRARVTSLRVTGPKVDNGVEIASRLKVRVGSTFDRAEVMDRIDRYTEDLHARGFLQARVELEERYSADGQQADVTIALTRGPHVTLVFRGDPLPDDRREELVPIRREGSADEDLLEDARRRIEEYLRGEGYREATAPYTREPRGEDEMLLVFTVKRGPQYKVADIEITGANQVPVGTWYAGLKLARGQWFVKERLDGDAAVIAEQYRRQGFREVKVEPSVVAQATQEALLTARIAITEGPRTVVRDTVFEGNQAVPTTTLRSLVALLPGRPFHLAQLAVDRDAVLSEYLERGYQLASVDVTRTFSDDGTQATLRFVVQEGPRIVIDNVLVVGNQRTRLEMIERETGLTSGMPLSVSGLIEAQRRLSALGLFRRVQVTELQQGSETSRDVLVVVEEGPVNTIGYGGGLEGTRRTKRDAATGTAVERFDLAPRGFFEVGRRNIGGKNRSVNLFVRAAIRSSDQVNAEQETVDGSIPPLEDTGSGFREYRVLGAYREPRFLGSGVDVSITAVADQAIRSSFDFNRRQTFVEASHRFGRSLGLAGRYAFGRTRLFNERIAEEDRLDIDRIFNPGVRLGSFSGSLSHDTRDDAIEPTKGQLLLLDATLADKRFGSEVGFVKTYLQAFTFREVPVVPGAVLAVGARLGLARLLPEITWPPGDGDVSQEPAIPASERFFAGGDTTVRGFAQDKLGSTLLDRNGVSRGGNGLLIFNSELRFPLLQRFGLGGAAFLDVGNVFEGARDVSLNDLRSGAGFGIRWKSPVGPLRLDLGWKLKTIRFANGEREPRFAPYFTIGQAF